jgi:hypothetical protein
MGQDFRPVQEVCTEEREDCCDPKDACDVNCVQCACCATRPNIVTAMAVAVDLPGPPALARAAYEAAPASAPPTDILHIPKSV